jgi:hypothetical protein
MAVPDLDGGAGLPPPISGNVGARPNGGGFSPAGVVACEVYRGKVDVVVVESLLNSSLLLGGDPPRAGRVGCLANFGGNVDASEFVGDPLRSAFSHLFCCLASSLSPFFFTILASLVSIFRRQKPVKVSF